ncbi:hypothetical protein BX616_000643 [Lobosporangium transversale]|uniref:O-methyltransferase n=1 Tax=Lobosporangium transversale TaxID=64571 RepID=A0A1Y2H086_9FUNG|nr:O-methyltransferase [Lobosporangium transversale]KAF9906714.1 hypothetical protein BX616_000643 [Lobosporangium transversale]ORZ27968.1 O-methyltransferase [Lobosporangium transversale]|eukprot:XP_021885671.1 O-methyltransferase [Lobosporangium transversale]
MVQGQFLQFLMKITRPQHVLELGCFMGYSAMAMADGMPVGSTLYTCEIDSKAAELSQELFKEHGYHSSSNSANIQLLKGPAMSSLQELAKKNIKFDAIFLDADKGGYIKYYDFIMDNDMLAENGYILADNTLYYGLVLDADKRHKATGSTAAASDVDTTATTKPSLTLSQQSIKFNDPAYKQAVGDKIDKFNKHVVNDPRATVVLLPAFDGLGIIMKKK